MAAITINRVANDTKGLYVAQVEGFDEVGELTFSRASPTLVIVDHTGVPDSLRGRVWALAMMAFGLIPLGGLLLGGLAELLDAQSATFVAGAIMLLILVSLSAKLKSLWTFG